MKESWSKAYSFVRQSEGGNDDDPLDHGGRTSRGITQREYSSWRREQNEPPRDVWNASEEEIKTIYHDEYWLPHCDILPVGIDYLFFDMAVNAGPYRATVLLQRALGVTDDGRIGPITREAIRKADATTLISKYSETKIAFYRSLHQPHNIKGWLNRVAFVRNQANSMLA